MIRISLVPCHPEKIVCGNYHIVYRTEFLIAVAHIGALHFLWYPELACIGASRSEHTSVRHGVLPELVNHFFPVVLARQLIHPRSPVRKRNARIRMIVRQCIILVHQPAEQRIILVKLDKSEVLLIISERVQIDPRPQHTCLLALVYCKRVNGFHSFSPLYVPIRQPVCYAESFFVISIFICVY